MTFSYYPGCTLKTKASNLEDSALACMEALGIEVTELPTWYCCGTVYSLANDDLTRLLAPLRNLIRIRDEGGGKAVTLCSFCYNTLKRANGVMREDAEKRTALNGFLDEEADYSGEVRVVHLLEILRDEIGWEGVAQQVRRPLDGLKLAPYYGCTLLRPEGAGIDHPERPTVLRDFIEALGGEAVNFPFAAECCGAFQVVNHPELVQECAWNILSSALRWGAEALVTSCPLCEYNLSRRQEELTQKYSDYRRVPILYFTQALALSLGLAPKVCRFELNGVDPRPLLERKGLLG